MENESGQKSNNTAKVYKTGICATMAYLMCKYYEEDNEEILKKVKQN